MKLFKYVPPERVDILANERIAFTPPGKFSDPNEMRLKLSSAAKNEFKRRLYKEEKERAEREVLGYRQKTSRQRKLERKEQTRGLNIGKLADESFQATIKRESQRMGVLCLCTNIKNNLMWDHYAKGFQGFAIELDSNDEEFREKLGMSWEVEYVDEPPAFDYSRPIPHFFRFKSKCYKYEGEYRIVRPLSECTPDKDKSGVQLFFRPLPRACVKAVYLGHQMEPPARERILELLKGTEVQKFDVDSNQKGYELSFTELK